MAFKPEQLWTIQHQVFNLSYFATAKSVEAQVDRANFWSNWVGKILWGITAVSFLLSLIVYMLASRISKTP